MDYITPELVAVTVYNVCQQFQADIRNIPKWQDVAILIGTAATETGFVLGGKRKRKAATFGLYGLGIRYAGLLYGKFRHDKSFMSWREVTKKWRNSKTSWSMFSKGWLGINTLPFVPLTDKELRYLMVHDMRFATAMCRWAYLNLMTEELDSLSAISEFWSEKFNLDPQRTGATFMDAWHENECNNLMSLVGYE